MPPIVDGLAAAFDLSASAAGALTTVPVLCMGLFAPLAAAGARRFGESATLALAVGLLGAGCLLRAVAGVAGLYAGTAVAGAGIAVAGALLPSVVRGRVPDRVGPVTGLYTAALIAGAFLAAGLTEPLRHALGLGPQTVLAVWAVPAAVALVVWLLVRSPGTARGGPRVPLPWRSGAAWLGTLFMGTQSLLFYGALAWLAAVYTRLGMGAARAGLLLALFSATQMVFAFAMPVLAHRFGRLPLWTVGSVLVTTVGLFLVALTPWPFAATPWLWASLLGLGMGGNLSLALTVVTALAPTPRAASAYTGMAFLVGYVLAALGPVALGRLTDLTGGYRASFLVLGAVGIVTAVVGAAASTAVGRPERVPAP
ncbi:MFS transporter [Virgisporangium ochraceum]|uniref:MFS transporter n=1 Tax=Virgisporangium ochraceum TaxID=65505 RepID=A0A8J3ZYC3_9ACTN|nr:MFS transporter [Virgisporangium ochraceum]GIJ72347.1 MFS transporter [Virgisporangium ochraceum]